jgi:hypothetical protein
MQILNASRTRGMERTGRCVPHGPPQFGARHWRLPPKGANTLHKHLRAEEFYFALVGPDQLRQVFNDTDAEVLWLILGAPEGVEFLPGAKTKPDRALFYPTDPTQLPKELAGVEWLPKG